MTCPTSPTGQLPPSPTRKKQKKKHFPPSSSSIDHSVLLSESNHGSVAVATLPECHSLFACLQHLSGIMDPKSQKSRSASLLLAITRRTLDSIGILLAGVLSPNHSPSSASLQLIKSLSSVLSHTLTLVLSGTTSKAKSKGKTQAGEPKELDLAVDEIMGLLLTGIFRPVVRSFMPASRVFVSAVFSSTSTRNKKHDPTSVVDLRADLLGLCENVNTVLDDFSLANPTRNALKSVRSLKNSIILEALRELEGLCLLSEERYAESASRTERLEVLSTKDAWWYLCTLLDRLIGSCASSGKSASSAGAFTPRIPASAKGGGANEDGDGVLARDVLLALDSLIERTERSSRYSLDEKTANGDGRFMIDEVERGMLMAVIEKAWLNGLGA
ncbi:hypothetical protein JAAARDRAFT_356698 [Jaapia argillacea MUCL 33604]|uniref:Uncharacterized protein n=1 Tax=Jaapia argillacea MUCL 33604 TaxID=933084 RepID=A0A067PUP5_9AGAM|nr:hypothetical protein JAAARDRAFT_356698 [Jaapia argillacea MUCL 33604]